MKSTQLPQPSSSAPLQPTADSNEHLPELVWTTLRSNGPQIPLINSEWEAYPDSQKILIVLDSLDTPFANFLRKELTDNRHNLSTYGGLGYAAHQGGEESRWALWHTVWNQVRVKPAVYPPSDATIRDVVVDVDRYVHDICEAIRNSEGDLLDNADSRDIKRVTDATWPDEHVFSTAVRIMVELIRRCVIGFCDRHRHEEATAEDLNSSCLDRIKAVVQTLRITKAACRDVLQEHSRIEMLVHGPRAIYSKKHRQWRTNRIKAENARKNRTDAEEMRGLRQLEEAVSRAQESVPLSSENADQTAATTQVAPDLQNTQQVAPAAPAAPKKKRATRRATAPMSRPMSQFPLNPQHQALNIAPQASSSALQQAPVPTQNQLNEVHQSSGPEVIEVQATEVQARSNRQSKRPQRALQPTMTMQEIKSLMARGPSRLAQGSTRAQDGSNTPAPGLSCAVPSAAPVSNQPTDTTSVGIDPAFAAQTTGLKRGRNESEPDVPRPRKFTKVNEGSRYTLTESEVLQNPVMSGPAVQSVPSGLVDPSLEDQAQPSTYGIDSNSIDGNGRPANFDALVDNGFHGPNPEWNPTTQDFAGWENSSNQFVDTPAAEVDHMMASYGVFNEPAAPVSGLGADPGEDLSEAQSVPHSQPSEGSDGGMSPELEAELFNEE